MGIAVLSGILASLNEIQAPRSQFPTSGTSTPAELPSQLPSRFIACVRRPVSAKRVHRALAEYAQDVTVVQNDNVSACEKADIVLLGCKPAMVIDGILGVPGMREALQGKLIISILAGVTVKQIEAAIYGPSLEFLPLENACRVVRATPNTAAGIRESMTTIATPVPALTAEFSSLVSWICRCIGEAVELPESMMDASTALCGSGPAFYALMLEAMADGSVAMGVPRAEAIRMAAQGMRGAAGLVLSGLHPAILRDQVSTPGGCTIGGLLVLEEGTVRGTVARAVREATVVASQLGKGVVGVNGTRF